MGVIVCFLQARGGSLIGDGKEPIMRKEASSLKKKRRNLVIEKKNINIHPKYLDWALLRKKKEMASCGKKTRWN